MPLRHRRSALRYRSYRLRGTTGLHGGVGWCGGMFGNTRNRCEIRPYDAKKSSARTARHLLGVRFCKFLGKNLCEKNARTHFFHTA